MYAIEIFGALLLCIHGLLAVALVDHIKKLGLIKCIIMFTKVVSMFYGFLIVFRVIMYIFVHFMLIKVDSKDKDQGFGNFLASYMFDNKPAAACTTLLIMLVFLVCLLLNWYTYKMGQRLEYFAEHPYDMKKQVLNINCDERESTDFSRSSIKSEVQEKKRTIFFCLKKKRKQVSHTDDEIESE